MQRHGVIAGLAVLAASIGNDRVKPVGLIQCDLQIIRAAILFLPGAGQQIGELFVIHAVYICAAGFFRDLAVLDLDVHICVLIYIGPVGIGQADIILRVSRVLNGLKAAGIGTAVIVGLCDQFYKSGVSLISCIVFPIEAVLLGTAVQADGQDAVCQLCLDLGGSTLLGPGSFRGN